MAKSNLIVPFNRKPPKSKRDLRAHLDGTALLGKLNDNLRALDKIDEQLAESIQDFEREVMDNEGNVVRTETYTSTTLDKETIAVFHTRQAGHKMQIDTVLKMLNKVMPDLKALEVTDNIKDASTKALEAFATAASEA